MNKIKISENFNLSEFECPCCHKVMLSEDLFAKVDKLRKLLKKSIFITSGYRCNEYNKKVGGVEGSYHKLGLAVDIEITDFLWVVLYPIVKTIGFTGIGVYLKEGYCHLDIRPGKLIEWNGGDKI
jgi:uncharacterized protein YcbK (DUF882 family)